MAERDKKGKKRKLAGVVLHQSKEKNVEENGDDLWDIGRQIQGEVSNPPAKKRRSEMAEKLCSEADGRAMANSPPAEAAELDTSRPSAVFKPTKGRNWTVSIALTGSFLNNVKSYDQKVSLVGRIARAAAVFSVDEIIIFDDDPMFIPGFLDGSYRGSPNDYWSSSSYLLSKMGKRARKANSKSKTELLNEVPAEEEAYMNPDQFMYHVLSYLETPPHLRKYLFPRHANLNGAGKLPSLDMPHHMKAHEWCQYREGVTLPLPSSGKSKNNKRSNNKKEQEYSLVETGLPYPVKIPIPIPPDMRVTLKFTNGEPPSWPNLSQKEVESLEVEAVNPATPREEAGYYWGYTVRRAESLSAVYTESPFLPNGYDFTIGTSERGVPLSTILPNSPTVKNNKNSATSPYCANKLLDQFEHLLLVFGGVAGLEPAVANDPEIQNKMELPKERASEAFDAWVNLVPGQGSRTIRTEEAVWLGLMGLRDYVARNGER
ncbi:DUF171-domain-containing protein [Lojkania enalia]|uniref:DUF171-domain-containing protein n=1 Tax=Lojkania enalia TaxID=147567 RepID=A0A9P4KBR3_9PLEO|nr:DUF171-domain-containing protein [Didymosphaeria enalia]